MVTQTPKAVRAFGVECREDRPTREVRCGIAIAPLAQVLR